MPQHQPTGKVCGQGTSFAVFFLHGYPRAALRAGLPDDIHWNIALWLLAWASTTLAVAALCTVVAYGIRRLLGARSRYVIGM
jgi:hypothetical protein